MNNGPQQETVKKPKRRWGTLGQWSIRLWLCGVLFYWLSGLLSRLSNPYFEKGSGLSESLFLQVSLVLSMMLIALAVPAAIVALKRRQKEDMRELVAAIIGLSGPAMVVCLIIASLLQHMG
jgi:hypothetical protein